MEILKRVAATALVCGAAGCEFLREPTFIDPPEDLLQVHSVLHAGADTVKVLVSRSGVSGGQSVVTPVSGARVRIAGGGTEVTLREAPGGFSGCVNRVDPNLPSAAELVMAPGCYAAVVPGGIRSGERYLLSVELTDGGRVTGETVVPRPAEILRPAENARLTVQRFGGPGGGTDSVLVRWRTPLDAVGSFPQMQAGTVYRSGTAVPGATCQVHFFGPDVYGPGGIRAVAPEDSLRGQVQFGGCQVRSGNTAAEVRPDSIDALFVVQARDSAYARYARPDRDAGVRRGSRSHGLRGAYGLFGSVATGTRRVRLLFTGP